MQRYSSRLLKALPFWWILFLPIVVLGDFPFLNAADKPTPAKQPADKKTTAKTPLFETEILPIFKAKCTGCHNPKSKKAELDLTTLIAVMKGSESGAIVEKNKPDESLLYEMVHEGLMPPEESKKPLTKAEIKLIERWIKTGAKSKSAVVKKDRLNQHDIIPIMNLRCTVCHGSRKREAGLDLRTRASMLKGGKSGPAIVPGKPKESLVLKRIHAREMPPRKLLVDFGVRPIESPEIETLTKWIAQGAPQEVIHPDVATTEPDSLVTDDDRQFWAFVPPKRPAVPKITLPVSPPSKEGDQKWGRVRNAIDAFLLKKLEEHNLSFSPEADKLTLIRRVAFDLTGLPPRWKDVENFLADDSPKAYEDIVERYLASPQYGERWGQYWLDITGYSDSEGKRSADVVRRFAWRYRDYVIRAFNNDKPYDRFLLEQLAGDELEDYENADALTPQMMENLVATGFLRMAPDGTGSDIVNTVVERIEVVTDELDVLGAGVMGLTLKCAQCHSHKYDPIPQRDYYRIVAVFKGAYDVHDWLKSTSVANQTKGNSQGRVLLYSTAEEKRKWETEQALIQKQINEVQAKLAAKQKGLIEKHVTQRLAELPKPLHEDLRKMLATPAGKRDEIQNYLASNGNELKKIDAGFKEESAAADKNVKTLKAKMPQEPGIRALWDRGEPSPTYIFRRGESTSPGRLVGPGVPSVLTDGKTPFDAKPPWPGAKKTGRRLAFAKWLIDPDHPLTARVMVNRIWYHHFGRGIVKSLGNFGKTGVPPSHPELLDWLAQEFVTPSSPAPRIVTPSSPPLHKRGPKGGWSIKAMHRLMMNSSAYRQASKLTPKLQQLDPENVLVSRMPIRRMEAEVVRDSILSVSGQLVFSPHGEPDPVDVRADGLVISKRGENGWRRSIYVLHRRKEMPTILENFDLPQMIPNCIERPDSTVSSQALHLMNNAMIRGLSDSFAERIKTEVGNDPYRQVERVYQIALNRMPTDEEKDLSHKTLIALKEEWKKNLKKDTDKKTANEDQAAAKALANFCHTMINSAAFLYID